MTHLSAEKSECRDLCKGNTPNKDNKHQGTPSIWYPERYEVPKKNYKISFISIKFSSFYYIFLIPFYSRLRDAKFLKLTLSKTYLVKLVEIPDKVSNDGLFENPPAQ